MPPLGSLPSLARRPARIAAAVVGAITMLAASAGAAPDPVSRSGVPDDALDRAIELLERADGARGGGRFDGPLDVVAREVAAGVPLRVEWDELAVLAIAPDDRIEFDAGDGTILDGLRALAASLGDSFDRPVIEALDGALVLTSGDGARRARHLDVYPVGDLLTHPERIARWQRQAERDRRLRERVGDVANPAELEIPDVGRRHDPFRPPLGPAVPRLPEPKPLPDDAPDEDGDGDATLPDAADEPDPTERLAWLVSDHVDPEAWLGNGGMRARIDVDVDALVVTGPASVHRRVRELLRLLRAAHPAAVTTRVEVLTMPAALLDSIERTTHSGIARAINSLQRGSDPDDVVRERRATVRASISKPATIRTGDGRTAWTLRVEPTVDAEARRIDVAIRSSWTEGDEERASAESVLSVPMHGGLTHIVLPDESVASGNRVRVLLIEIRPD